MTTGESGKRPAVLPPPKRDIVFISKATPEDDEFALWLGPRLEEAGYTVFTDILCLEPGERWRKTLTATLQNQAVKVLLCCRDTTLAKEGVQEEIGMALDLAKLLPDPKFLIPLRLEPYKKIFGMGELQYVNFAKAWADGLIKLLDLLKRQKVPRWENAIINPNWEIYRRRGAVKLQDEPERLTSNWLRIKSVPDTIGYYEPTGVVDGASLAAACDESEYPVVTAHRGFIAFGTVNEINARFASLGRFELKHGIPVMDFLANGLPACRLSRQDTSNILTSMFQKAWNTYCRKLGLREYLYSKATGFHASASLARIGQRIPWGRQGDRRSSMLRNLAKGHVWSFGVNAQPAFWPFPHFKLKSRVLFSAPDAADAGEPYDDVKKQHRLRRSVCKGWRNKQWHGRLMAYLELLSGDSSFITLALSEGETLRLESGPILFTSPVSTALPNLMDDSDEEADASTLGRPEPEEEE